MEFDAFNPFFFFPQHAEVFVKTIIFAIIADMKDFTYSELSCIFLKGTWNSL